MIHHSLARARAHGVGLLGVGEDPADGVGQGWSIVHGDQNPGLAIFDYFGDAPAVGSNHWLACCHAFDEDLAERLAGGGSVDYEGQLGDSALDVRTEARKLDNLLKTQLGGELTDSAFNAIFAKECRSDDDKAGFRETAVHLVRGLQEDVLALPGGDPTDQADAEDLRIGGAITSGSGGLGVVANDDRLKVEVHP